IPLPEYQRRRADLERRQEALARQEEQLGREADRLSEVAGLVSAAEGFCRRVAAGLASATFEQRRQLVELLIDRVIVTGDEVEIRYAIPTDEWGEHIRFCQLRLDYFPHPDLVDAVGRRGLQEEVGAVAQRMSALGRARTKRPGRNGL